MIDLNNPNSFKELDPKDVYGSTGMLSLQCKQVWEEVENAFFPDDYKNIKNIVITGMGGSAYGGHVVKALFKEELKLPIYVNSDYTLPGFVNEDTLVIVTSYSGSTEESLANAKEAKEKQAKVVGLTSGGKLADFMKTENYPALIFKSDNNPSNQPRLGTGYILLGTIGILKNLGILTIKGDDILKAVSELEDNAVNIKNLAMETAKKVKGSMPVIFAAEFLEGNAHIMRNQFNETSKSFSAFSELPELNHHLLEGLKNPVDKKLIVIMIASSLYSDVLKKRVVLTEDVVSKNSIEKLHIDALGTTKLSQVLTVLSLGGYITVFLAFLYNLDPSLIPWVDYFKEQLAK